MTCREKYVLDNAMKFAEGVAPPDCPDDYGYLKSTDVSDEFGYCLRPCKSCWDMEIPETDEIAKAEKENKTNKIKKICFFIAKNITHSSI